MTDVLRAGVLLRISQNTSQLMCQQLANQAHNCHQDKLNRSSKCQPQSDAPRQAAHYGQYDDLQRDASVGVGGRCGALNHES